MKFGKRLTSEAARHWDNQFLDYKACKKAVQRDVFAQGMLFAGIFCCQTYH